MKSFGPIMKESKNDKSFRDYFFSISDINFGIVLIGIFLLFDFGSVQGVFEIVNTLRLPFILSLISGLYALFLIFRNINEFKHEMTKRYFLLIVYIVIYTLISTIDPEKKIGNVTDLIQYSANYIIVVYCVKTPKQLILLLDIFLVSLLHSSYHSIAQGGKIYDSIWLRDENHISLVVAMGFSFAFVLYNESTSRIKKICYVLCLLFFIAANVVAASRGGGLALAAAGILSMRLYKNKKLRNIAVTAITIIFIFIYGANFIREMNTLKEGTEETTASARIYLWGIGLHMFFDHAIIGVGPSNYTENFIMYDHGRLNPEHPDFKYVTHSTPIQWLAEMGTVGTILLLLLQMSLYKNWKITNVNYGKIATSSNNYSFTNRLSHACAISQVSFWIGAIFLSLITYPFYWFLIPLSESCKRIYCANLPILDVEDKKGNVNRKLISLKRNYLE